MFRAPNIKGKRFRKGYTPVLTKELFEKFIKNHPQHKSLSIEKFTEIITHSSQRMWESIIEERDGLELPSGGSIFLGSTKILAKNNYNIQASIKANTPVKHRNYETDGYVAKIYYTPRLSKIPMRERSIWAFKANRTFRRTVSQTYPLEWKKYIAVVNTFKITKEYNKSKLKQYSEQRAIKETESYNEFDFN